MLGSHALSVGIIGAAGSGWAKESHIVQKLAGPVRGCHQSDVRRRRRESIWRKVAYGNADNLGPRNLVTICAPIARWF